VLRASALLIASESAKLLAKQTTEHRYRHPLLLRQPRPLQQGSCRSILPSRFACFLPAAVAGFLACLAPLRGCVIDRCCSLLRPVPWRSHCMCSRSLGCCLRSADAEEQATSPSVRADRGRARDLLQKAKRTLGGSSSALLGAAGGSMSFSSARF
jgi:hypothetical protein